MTVEQPALALVAGYVPLDIVCYRGQMWRAAGGTAGNVAAILSFLGWDSRIVADLGDDLAGHEVKRDLMSANVSVDLLRLVKDRKTPRLIHEIGSHGHRYRFSCPSCHRRFPSSRPLLRDRAEELIRMQIQPDVYLFDRLNTGTVLLAEHFANAGSLVIFEPSVRGRLELTERALDSSHIVKRADDRDPGFNSTLARKHQVWIVTNGSEGARFRVGSGTWYRSKSYASSIVDAGGAGDWMTAGLIHVLRSEGSLADAAVRRALRWAQALAAVSCRTPGARGLAHQQSAEAVIHAATSLQDHQVREGPLRFRENSIARSVSNSTCGTCLQARTTHI